MFSDADMAGDIDGRQSTSSVLVFLESSPISWLSLKQKVLALSTACQPMWLRRLLGELTGVEAHPPVLMVDNQPAIALAKNLVSMIGASTSTSSSTSSGTVSMEGR